MFYLCFIRFIAWATPVRFPFHSSQTIVTHLLGMQEWYILHTNSSDQWQNLPRTTSAKHEWWGEDFAVDHSSLYEECISLSIGLVTWDQSSSVSVSSFETKASQSQNWKTGLTDLSFLVSAIAERTPYKALCPYVCMSVCMSQIFNHHKLKFYIVSVTYR